MDIYLKVGIYCIHSERIKNRMKEDSREKDREMTINEN
jgi:hypothetical protein